MPVDLSKPFNKRPYDEFDDSLGELEAHHMNDIYQGACVTALERAREEIDVASSNTMSGEYDYQRGLMAASAIITRLLESKP